MNQKQDEDMYLCSEPTEKKIANKQHILCCQKTITVACMVIHGNPVRPQKILRMFVCCPFIFHSAMLYFTRPNAVGNTCFSFLLHKARAQQ